MHALLWVIEGLVAGWVLGKVMAGEGRDLVMDVVMGAAGGIAAGFIGNTLIALVHGRMIFTDLAAVTGAIMLTGLSRLISGRREYGATD